MMVWRNESQRHSMASRGVGTRSLAKRYKITKQKRFKEDQSIFIREELEQNEGEKLTLELFYKYGPKSVKQVISKIRDGTDDDHYFSISIPHNEPLLHKKVDDVEIVPISAPRRFGIVHGSIADTDKPTTAIVLRTDLVTALTHLLSRDVPLKNIGIKNIEVPRMLSLDYWEGRIYIETTDGRIFKTYGPFGTHQFDIIRFDVKKQKVSK